MLIVITWRQDSIKLFKCSRDRSKIVRDVIYKVNILDENEFHSVIFVCLFDCRNLFQYSHVMKQIYPMNVHFIRIENFFGGQCMATMMTIMMMMMIMK